MHHIYLDPFLFACPTALEGKDGFDTFLDGVLFINDLKESGWAQIFLTATTYDALWSANRYPLNNDLHAAMTEFGLRDEIQPRDIIEIVNGLLQKLSTVEAYLGISDVLFDQFVTTPTLSLATRPQTLRDSFISLLVLCALVKCLKSQPEEMQISLARGAGEYLGRMSIQARIIDIDGLTTLTLPFPADGSFWLCRDQDSLATALDVENLWMIKPIGVFQTLALRTIVLREAGKRGPGSSKPLDWSFGKTFFATAESLGFLDDGKKAKVLLKSCMESVLQSNLRSTHALRTGSGGNNSQRLRGEDKAWRRDIDYEYHLHYWETSSEIEFASVVVHNDFTIPD